jgi:hypothetical protein
MTFQDYLKGYLYKGGFFEDMAEKVVERIKADPANEPMLGRWEDHTEGYPPEMLAVMRVSANRHAVEWIDENLPAAWFRGVFAND